ncbi:MAG: hypothetical protein ACUVR8_13180 [Acidobacteriota bacterium]
MSDRERIVPSHYAPESNQTSAAVFIAVLAAQPMLQSKFRATHFRYPRPISADTDTNRKIFARKALDKDVNKLFAVVIAAFRNRAQTSPVNIPDR